MKNTLVREYKSQKAFQQDAERLAEQGYSVVSVTESQPRSGCMRIVFLNFLALLWKPPHKFVVTYQRTAPATP